MRSVEEIAQRHADWLRMARFHGARNPDDVLQEVYIKLLEKEQKDQGLEVNDGYMWLVIRSHTHKTREAPREEINERMLPEDDEPKDEEKYSELIAVVECALNEIDAYHRRLFVHMAIEGVSEREMAERTGISRRSIRHTKEIVRQYVQTKCEQRNIEP